MSTDVQINSGITNLSLYMVNTDWRLCRIINTSCKFYRNTIFPMIEFTDPMIKRILNKDTMYFFEPKLARINFECMDDLRTLCDNNYPLPQTIKIEVLDVGDTYVLLSPGMWVTPPNNSPKYRMYDNTELYQMVSMLSAEAILGTDFNFELLALLNRLNDNNSQDNTASRDTLEENSSDS